MLSKPCATLACVNGDRIATTITTPHAIAASVGAAHKAHRKRRPRSGLLSVRVDFMRTSVPHRTAMSTTDPMLFAGLANRSQRFTIRWCGDAPHSTRFNLQPAVHNCTAFSDQPARPPSKSSRSSTRECQLGARLHRRRLSRHRRRPRLAGVRRLFRPGTVRILRENRHDQHHVFEKIGSDCTSRVDDASLSPD